HGSEIPAVETKLAELRRYRASLRGAPPLGGYKVDREIKDAEYALRDHERRKQAAETRLTLYQGLDKENDQNWLSEEARLKTRRKLPVRQVARADGSVENVTAMRDIEVNVRTRDNNWFIARVKLDGKMEFLKPAELRNPSATERDGLNRGSYAATLWAEDR